MLAQSQILPAGQLGTLPGHRSCSCSKDTGLWTPALAVEPRPTDKAAGVSLCRAQSADHLYEPVLQPLPAGVRLQPRPPTHPPGLWALRLLPETPATQQASCPCSDLGWACQTSAPPIRASQAASPVPPQVWRPPVSYKVGVGASASRSQLPHVTSKRLFWPLPPMLCSLSLGSAFSCLNISPSKEDGLGFFSVTQLGLQGSHTEAVRQRLSKENEKFQRPMLKG